MPARTCPVYKTAIDGRPADVVKVDLGYDFGCPVWARAEGPWPPETLYWSWHAVATRTWIYARLVDLATGLAVDHRAEAVTLALAPMPTRRSVVLDPWPGHRLARGPTPTSEPDRVYKARTSTPARLA